MSELLLFGGTTEGRELAEFCEVHAIPTEICVTTDYGASLLPHGMTVHVGRLTAEGMQCLMRKNGVRLAVDATHPYAAEATRNIRTACAAAGVSYLRLIRQTVPVQGENVTDMPSLVMALNRHKGVILSTLGSKSLPALTAVQNYTARLWVRVLPAEGIIEHCRLLGFPETHILLGKGPFTIEQNVCHIRQSRAALLVTKESGSTGGYPEKLAAAEQCGIPVITLLREPETGYTLEEIKALLQGGLCSLQEHVETESPHKLQ